MKLQRIDPNHKYAVIGLGATGLSVYRHLRKHGVNPLVCDTRQNPPGLDGLPSEAEVLLGELDQKRLLDFDVVVLSPGMALNHPVLQRLVQAGVAIVGDIELFSWEAQAPIIAVTGSNGKSTLVSLVYEMAKNAGVKVALGGNIGIPALSILDSEVELYVLELSSFQLETTYSLQATAASILNLSEDHMDRYPDFDAYVAAKHVIYAGAQTCVVNADDQRAQPENPIGDVLEFSLNNSTGYHYREADKALYCEQELLCNSHDIALVGKHNYANALAAIALCDAVGIERSASLAVLKSFGGLAHRSQCISKHAGISWVNDSKGTNVGATVAAIQGLADEAPLWLIVGGDAKSADLSPLQQYLPKVAGVIAFGKDQAEFLALDSKVVACNNLDEAVAWCAEQASEGDIVLLSPASASTDMYPNFMARGEHFTALVNAL